jgi:hypothetical protein
MADQKLTDLTALPSDLAAGGVAAAGSNGGRLKRRRTRNEEHFRAMLPVLFTLLDEEDL